MSNLETARARVREAMIDTMDPAELRALLGKIELVLDGGSLRVDEATFEEWTADVIGAREAAGE